MLHEGSFSAGYPVEHWHSIDTLNSGPVAPQAAPSGTGLASGYIWYVPIMVCERVTVKKLWVACDSTGGSTVYLGLYDVGGTRLTNGSASHPASTTELVIDVTDVVIDPGIYYFAILGTTASVYVYRLSLISPIEHAMGIWLEGSGSETSLPATATFGIDDHLAMPIGGILTNTVVS